MVFTLAYPEFFKKENSSDVPKVFIVLQNFSKVEGSYYDLQNDDEEDEFIKFDDMVMTIKDLLCDRIYQ